MASIRDDLQAPVVVHVAGANYRFSLAGAGAELLEPHFQDGSLAKHWYRRGPVAASLTRACGECGEPLERLERAAGGGWICVANHVERS